MFSTLQIKAINYMTVIFFEHGIVCKATVFSIKISSVESSVWIVQQLIRFGELFNGCYAIRRIP